MQRAVEQAEAAFGPCNIMICNAGATEPGIARAWTKMLSASIKPSEWFACRPNRGPTYICIPKTHDNQLSGSGAFSEGSFAQHAAATQRPYLICVLFHGTHWCVYCVFFGGLFASCIPSNPAVAGAGFAGYSAYAPTKWAVRGLADTLRNEVRHTCSLHFGAKAAAYLYIDAVSQKNSTAP